MPLQIDSGDPAAAAKAELAALLAEHGRPTFAEVFKSWMQRPQGLNGLQFYWSVFLREWPAYFALVVDEREAKAKRERREAERIEHFRSVRSTS
jgi:hypothetical protein